MATTQEYAQLSLYVYHTTEIFNRPSLPQGWTQLEYHADNLLGLSYGIFQRSGTNEIVLAYTGSNETLTVDYAFTNLPAGLGLPSAQIPAAALIYQQAKEKYGSNITLSGHSLGGGLASVMATWFNRQAVLFDEAPFQLTATNPTMLGLVRAQLLAASYSDAAMDTAISSFVSREAQVANNVLTGNSAANVLSGGAGNDTMFCAIYLVASHACQSGATGRFDCEYRVHKARKQCLRWRLDRSNVKTAHAGSMRLAGHKWLGRRMDAAWSSSGIQTNTQTRKVPQ